MEGDNEGKEGELERLAEKLLNGWQENLDRSHLRNFDGGKKIWRRIVGKLGRWAGR